jgi:carbon-monoxide dehydrogenase large subunit
MRWVGRPLPRHEDPALLQGRGRFTADVARGARALRFVRSPLARGNILGIAAPPGATVVTAADLADVGPICARLDRPDYVAIPQPILAADRVTHVGEPIAAVIADTAAVAEDLAERVVVEIAAETPVVTLDQALASGAPLVHAAAAENTLIDANFATPDTRAFATAYAVIDFAFTSRRQAALPLETRGAVAAVDPATGRVTLTVSAQMPPASPTRSACRRPNCASSPPKSAAASGRRCRSTRSTSSRSGLRSGFPVPSPGSRTGSKT